MSLRELLPETVTLITTPGADIGAVLLLRMDYSSPVRANSSGWDFIFQAETYLRTAGLGAVGAVKDTVGEIEALRFTLSGVPSENLALALNESARNKRCRLWLGICRTEPRAIVEGVLVFDGVLDQLPIEQAGDTCTISATALHMGAFFRRPRSFRYSQAEQLEAAPGDTSGRFLVSQAQAKDVWPAASWGQR